MTRTTILALAAAAVAFGLPSTGAFAAKHHAKHRLHVAAAPAKTATPIMGVNPMTIPAPIAAVSSPAQYVPAPGVNPMISPAPIAPVKSPAQYAQSPGVNPMINAGPGH
jgi:hypothetical protein